MWLLKFSSKLLSRTSLSQGFVKMSTKSQTIQVNGQTLNYLKVGNGPKNLFCFPGALGTIWTDFKPQIAGFDRSKFTIIAWDPPGYGLSCPPSKRFDLDFYDTDAEFAYQLLKTIGVDKFSLLGWSDGGISSMILSAKYPEDVEKLIIWGANAYVLPEEVQIYENIRDVSKWSSKMRTPMIKLYTEEGLQNMFSSWCDTLAAISKNGGDLCKDKLPKIKCPTFILHGDKDPMIAPEHPDYLFSQIKHAKLHRFHDGKHNIHLRYPEEFNKLVTEFLLL